MFIDAYKKLGIAALLLKCNIIKGCGFGVSTVFLELLLLVFTGKNLYVAMNSRYSFDFKGKKDVYYRFLNDPHFNWGKFVLQLAIKVISICNYTFTGTPRPCFLVMDDSIIRKDRSSCVELLSQMFDHVDHKQHRGFNLLMLGWTDGYTFLPVQFLMMCAAEHRIQKSLKKDP